MTARRLVALSLCTLLLVHSVSSQPVDTASGLTQQQVRYTPSSPTPYRPRSTGGSLFDTLTP